MGVPAGCASGCASGRAVRGVLRRRASFETHLHTRVMKERKGKNGAREKACVCVSVWWHALHGVFECEWACKGVSESESVCVSALCYSGCM